MERMTNNDLSITQNILAAGTLLREISSANRAGAVHEVTEHAKELAKIVDSIRARSIALHFAKPLQVLPLELAEEVE
jgi:hypothetical protein